MLVTPDGLMEIRLQNVEFTKKIKGEDEIRHKARIITYVDMTKKRLKLVSLLTNDMEMSTEEIIAIYRQR